MRWRRLLSLGWKRCRVFRLEAATSCIVLLVEWSKAQVVVLLPIHVKGRFFLLLFSSCSKLWLICSLHILYWMSHWTVRTRFTNCPREGTSWWCQPDAVIRSFVSRRSTIDLGAIQSNWRVYFIKFVFLVSRVDDSLLFWNQKLEWDEGGDCFLTLKDLKEKIIVARVSVSNQRTQRTVNSSRLWCLYLFSFSANCPIAERWWQLNWFRRLFENERQMQLIRFARLRLIGCWRHWPLNELSFSKATNGEFPLINTKLTMENGRNLCASRVEMMSFPS